MGDDVNLEDLEKREIKKVLQSPPPDMLEEITPNAFALPASTPAVVPYPNLINSTQVSSTIPLIVLVDSR